MSQYGSAALANLKTLAAVAYGTGPTLAPNASGLPTDFQTNAGTGVMPAAYQTTSAGEKFTEQQLGGFDKDFSTKLLTLAGNNSHDRQKIQHIIDTLEGQLKALPDTPAGRIEAAADIERALGEAEKLVGASYDTSTQIGGDVQNLASKYLGVDITIPHGGSPPIASLGVLWTWVPRCPRA